ncbi:MAG: Glycerol kinase [Candidatus Thorarchaeota archaeon AB_25]|nr:MAG: Glycerol kinase [Candidatus Thorarchaeota archaeon AB_25]
MTEIVLAIDAGTTGVRSMFFDKAGNVLGAAYSEYESTYPRPSWVEQDAESWWTQSCETIKRALSETGLNPERIIGISVTNQRETIVPIGEDGAPLHNAIVWQDRRTLPQCDWIEKELSQDAVYSITGLTVDPYFSAPKILWFKQNEESVFKNTHKFLLVHDYLIYRLSDELVTDFSNASRTMLFDVRQAVWSERILDGLGIPKEKLPTTVESGTMVGELTSKASDETGLKEGTPVVAGGGDQQCAALGVGVVKEGRMKSTTGTGTFILAHSKTVRLDPGLRVLCSRHVVPNSFVVEASMFTTGSALKWFRDNLGSEERIIADEKGVDPYEIITEEASKIPAGSEGVLHIPHFAGSGAPYWNPHSRGIFAGLALGHTRAHIVRSILEGVSYEIRTNIEVMRELGLPSREIRVTGGAARSEAWMQIQANILRIPVIRTQMEEATAVGAAILACKGIGVFKSVSQAAEEMVKTLDQLLPTKESLEVYQKGYKKFKALYSAISDLRLDDD